MRLLPVIDRQPLMAGEGSVLDYVDLVVEVTVQPAGMDDGDLMEVVDVADLYEMAALALTGSGGCAPVSQPTIRTPRMLVLRTQTWETELTLELQRLGHSPEKSAYVARKVLRRICGRAGWQRQAFIVDDAVAAET